VGIRRFSAANEVREQEKTRRKKTLSYRRGKSQKPTQNKIEIKFEPPLESYL
jgi:hypothetical protein